MKISAFIIPIRFSQDKNYYHNYLEFASKLEHFGFDNVYIGEHLTDEREDIRSSMIFAAALLSRTKKINVGLASIPLIHYGTRHLIKALEDLYLLSQNRLKIGLSPGALKSDLEYLGINPEKRFSLFEEKIEDFYSQFLNSNIFKDFKKSNIFTTSLGTNPISLSKSANRGMSFISSNFTNREWLENHKKCYFDNLKADTNNNESLWSVAWNYLPDYLNYKEGSKKIIHQSNMYIRNKLDKFGNSIVFDGNTKISSNNLKRKLIGTHSREELIQFTKNNNCDVIVNIYDILHDKAFVNGIFNIPRDLRNESSIN